MIIIIYKIILAYVSYTMFKLFFNNTKFYDFFAKKVNMSTKKRMYVSNFMLYLLVTMSLLGVEMFIRGYGITNIYSYYIGLGLLFSAVDKGRGYIEN